MKLYENNLSKTLLSEHYRCHPRIIGFCNEKGWYNLRQIEVVKDEIIEANKHKYHDYSQIGVISPYRWHVIETKNKIRNSELEVDTVHKFQVREFDIANYRNKHLKEEIVVRLGFRL